jgi:hypothetical protein
MKNLAKIRFAVSALVLTAGPVCYGQAIPAGTSAMSPTTGLNLSSLDGIVHYAVSGSEVINFGYYGQGQVTNSSAISGDVSYTAKSQVHPFSFLFAGGIVLPNSSGQSTSYYSSAAVSQGLITRSWVFNVSDSVSFLPQSPSVGLSGIPGVGDLGAVPVQGPIDGPAGGILSTSGNRIANSLTGSAERQINHNTSISGSGSWSFLDLLEGSNGFDSSTVSGSVAANRRLNARSSLSLSAGYSTFDYGNNGTGQGGTAAPSINNKSLSLSYQRTLSRRLSLSLSAGPQWVSSSNSALVPSSLSAGVSAGLSYSRGLTGSSLSYSRGINPGSGVLPGSESQNVAASIGHTYGKKWMTSASASYGHSDGLARIAVLQSLVDVHEVFDTVVGGVQVTRGFGPHISGYASYSISHQSSKNSLPGLNAFDGTSQSLGFGVSYSPRSTRLGQF